MFEGLGHAFLILISAGVGTLVDELAGRQAFGALCGMGTFVLVYVFLYAAIDRG